MVRDIDEFRRDVLVSELQYAVDMLQMIPPDRTEVLSPANLSLALTLIHQGTKGETRKKINEVLLNGVCNAHFLVNQIFLQKYLQSNQNGVVLKIANQLFLSKRIPVKKEYKNDLKNKFDAETKSMDFKNEAECVKAITDFVKNATNGKLQSGIDQSTIADSDAFIICVLYAKGSWYEPFKLKQTKIGKFTKGDGKTEDVWFMRSEVTTGYFSHSQVQVVSKEYSDAAFQFVWILPKNCTSKGFEEYRKNLTGKKIQEYLAKMEEHTINLKVPKMAMKCKFDMLAILKHLGLMELTTFGADFSGITDGAFSVKSGSHSTVLEVDEFGSVAVAVTEMMACFEGDSEEPPRATFHATHPFIFLMHKNQHPIMIGQYHGQQK